MELRNISPTCVFQHVSSNKVPQRRKGLMIIVAIIALLILVAIGALAQDPQGNRTIRQRQQLQQQRIGQGVESGQLTAGEAARLERKEAQLNRQVRRMRQDGLTDAERARIDQRQDHLSRQIAGEKHDPQRQPAPRGPIEVRDRNQQMRIGQGIRSGQLTAGEAARLESKEARLQRHEAFMRHSGSGLTPGERNAINHQQNNLSRQIYRQKHDGQRRHR
jgi:hypothetical protein